MRVDIITIFPDMLTGFFEYGVLKAARETGLIEINMHSLRAYTDDKHRQVDDRPYGGGAGMVLKVEPLVRAVEAISQENKNSHVILTSAQGKRLNQESAKTFSSFEQIILICGRYEGVDERVMSVVDAEISIGDYVLSGGEVAAATITEAVCRMIPGVVGDEESVVTDSFYQEQLVGVPQYTRPPEFRDLTVPDVLLSGNHEQIATWRREQSLKKTLENRPDLLKH